MCVNVLTAEGRHVGITTGWFRKKFLVALTEARAEELVNGMDYIKDVASVTEALTLFRKVNEEKLESVLNEWWQAQGLDNSEFDMDKAIRLFIIKNADNITFNIFNKMNLHEKLEVQKYFLAEPGEWAGMNLILAGKYDIPDIGDEIGFPALLGRITGLPQVHVEIMGALGSLLLGGGLSDMGGRNHTHTTVLEVRSGNATIRLELPCLVYARRDDEVAIELTGNPLDIGKHIYAGGVMFSIA